MITFQKLILVYLRIISNSSPFSVVRHEVFRDIFGHKTRRGRSNYHLMPLNRNTYMMHLNKYFSPRDVPFDRIKRVKANATGPRNANVT